ncbi:MAG: LPS export ABC transporter periplasmic protein LptC [Nitrospirae bacterium CG2_30_70_394]|nr:MAG: LPS export ABC transporter periplasmic protein LptC [Nitrospirae bacterium CG2_30_70_394]
MILRVTPTAALLTTLAVALMVTLYTLLARRPSPSPPLPPTAANGAPAVVTDFTFTETQGERTHWLLKAQRARYFERDNRVEVDTIRADLRDGERVVLHLEAANGRVDLASFTFDLTGGVRITDPDGLDLSTPQLHFDGERRQLSGDSTLDLHKPPYRIAGKRFTYDVTTRQLTVEEAVHLVVSPPPEHGSLGGDLGHGEEAVPVGVNPPAAATATPPSPRPAAPAAAACARRSRRCLPSHLAT